MKTRHLIVMIAATGLLASCGSTEDSEATAESTAIPQEGPSHTAFAEALSMVGNDGSMLAMPDTINFIDQTRINELADGYEPWRDIGADRTWQVLSYIGATDREDGTGESALLESSRNFLPLPDDLVRLDLPAADSMLFAGNTFHGGVRLVNGGQDTAQIEEFAREHGWEGESPLLEYEGGQPNIPQGTQLLLRDTSSVATAGPGLDFSDVDMTEGPTLADQDTITALRDCLGDAVRATVRYQIRPDATDWFSLGVVDGPDGPYSVVCSLQPNPVVAERVGERGVELVESRNISNYGPTQYIAGNGDVAGRPYSDYFRSAEYSVEEIDDVTGSFRTSQVRMVLPHVEDAPPGIIFAFGEYAAPGAS